MAVLHAMVSEDQLPGHSGSATGRIFSCYASFLYLCGAQIGDYGFTYSSSMTNVHRQDTSCAPGTIFDS